MERRGVKTDLGDINRRAFDADHRELVKAKRDVQKLRSGLEIARKQYAERKAAKVMMEAWLRHEALERDEKYQKWLVQEREWEAQKREQEAERRREENAKRQDQGMSRYQSGQLPGLLDDKRHGKASRLSDSQKEQIQRHVEANLYTDSSLIAAYVSLEFGVAYSMSGIKRLLHELNFVYKIPKHVPGKSDREAQAEFVKRFKEMMANKSTETPVYFSDAVHPTHTPKRTK